MPRVNVSTTYNSSIGDILILENYLNSCATLESRYQYMISEVVMLRLFSILEQSIADLACKFACGANYVNGRIPITHVRCRSIQDAAAQMIVIGRRRPLGYLKWTKINFIEDSIMHVLNTTDFFFVNLQNHSVIINEMRIVRNQVAHRTLSTTISYRNEIRRIYGANLNIGLGVFLLSTNRNPLANIRRYITSTRVILNDAIKGTL